jgi:hypothetical protein
VFAKVKCGDDLLPVHLNRGQITYKMALQILLTGDGDAGKTTLMQTLGAPRRNVGSLGIYNLTVLTNYGEYQMAIAEDDESLDEQQRIDLASDGVIGLFDATSEAAIDRFAAVWERVWEYNTYMTACVNKARSPSRVPLDVVGIEAMWGSYCEVGTVVSPGDTCILEPFVNILRQITNHEDLIAVGAQS